MRELGELIRAAREAKGVSLEQASAETRIRRAYLDAIEDGDFRIFPGGAYATGFLRNYAAYLGLNTDEVLQTYHVLTPPTGITIAPATTVGVERLRRRSRRRMTWAFISVVFFALCSYGIKQYSDTVNSANPPLVPPASLTAHNSHTTSSRSSDSNADYPPATHVVASKAVVRIHARRTGWVRVVRNGKVVFWGPVHKGTTRRWTGHKLRVSTRHGSSFKVWVDTTRAWHVSKSQGKVVLLAGPYTYRRIH